MATLTEIFSGTATIGTTEYSLPNASTTLTPRTEDGYLSLVLDTSAVAAGDLYELKVYEKVVSGGSQKVVETRYFAGATHDPCAVSIPYPFMHGWDITLKKISGTDRSFTWSIRSP